MKTAMRLVAVLTFLVLLFSASVTAHTNSQAGILEQEYIAEYERYGIGGEEIGWSVDEEFHIGQTAFQYVFSEVPTAIQVKFRTAASMWSEVATITESTSATGTVDWFNDPTDSAVAIFIPISVNENTGHLTQWAIYINLAYTITPRVLAHELGHVIGLNDLYKKGNSGLLMYGYTSGTATAPTESDLWGAKVILGIHTTHNMNNYRYCGDDENGRHCHVNFCSECNANGLERTSCIYLPFETHPVCPLCLTPRDAMG